MKKFQRVIACILSLVMVLTVISAVNPVAAAVSETIDKGIMARWVTGPNGYDDGFGMNGAGGADHAERLLNGDRFVRYDGHGFWNGRTALPVGSYYFKFLVKIKRGSGATDEGDRPFFVTLPGWDERADKSGPVLKAFPDDEWVTVSIPFVIGNSLAYRNIEYAIKGAMPWVIGGNDAECYLGRELVVSTNNEPLVYHGAVATYAMQGGYGDVLAVKGTLNDDKSRTYTGQDEMYQFKATLPEGKYWAKLITKTSGKNGDADLTGEISSFISSAGLNEAFPILSEYEDGKWKNVMIPFTVDAESANQSITYSILGPQNGAKDLTVEEYVMICDNDRPLELPQQEWRDRVMPASHLANGIGMNSNDYVGARPKFDAAKGFLELPSTLVTDRFVWDIGMNLSRKQFVDSGYISKGKVYVKVVAKVPTLASATLQNETLLNIEMRSGGDIVETAKFNYGLFTEADKYQTLIYEFDVSKHSSFGGSGEWLVRFDGRFFGGLSDLHVKSITLSANPDVNDDTTPIINGMIWPADQQLPSFGTPADILELVDVRDSNVMYRSAMTCLQGLVNKNQPRILVAEATEEADGNAYRMENKDYWPASMGLNYVHADGATSDERILKMIAKYSDEIDGFILYSGASNNYNDLNVATTIGGIYNAVPVTSAILSVLRAAPYNLDAGTWPVIKDISSQSFGSGTSSTNIRNSRVNAYNYLYDNYSPANAASKGNLPYNDRIITIINPEGHFAIRDLAVATASPVVWLDASNSNQRTVLDKFYTVMRTEHNGGLGAIAMGFWPNEEEGVKRATAAGITSVPSDNFENYSVYSGMSRVIDPPEIPKKPDLVGGINYISMAPSDGDNICYVEHGMRYGQRMGDRTRGYYPINWTMSPALLDAAPQMLQYYYNTATENDCFIIGPSGYGYTRSESWPSTTVNVNGASANWIQGYSALTNKYVEKTGLNYPTIWGNVLSTSNTNTFTQAKLNSFADFDYFPALGGLYYLNPTSTGQSNQSMKSANSDVRAQWFNFGYYANDGTGAGSIGTTSSSASTSSSGTIYGRIKGLSQTLANTTNTFNAVQICNWTGDMVPKMNDLQDFSNKNYAKNEFLRSDHYFMLMAEANGDPINNALQANTYASSASIGYESDNAVDGSFGRTHGWKASASGEQWLTIDFGKRQPISRYVLKNAELAGYAATYNTVGWEFQVSNDGREWISIDTVTDNADATVYRTATTSEPVRFVRILVTNPGGDGTARIQDVEIYGVNNWDRATLTYTTYKEDLAEEITIAEGLTEITYTHDTWQNIVEKKAIADEVMADVNATQIEIDDATLALRDAIAGLEELDLTELDTALLLAAAETQPEDEPNYSDESWEAFQEAYEAAQTVKAASEIAPMLLTQEDVDAAAENLNNAIEALTIDTTELEEKIEQAELITNASSYTEESWEAFQEALSDAETALASATTQHELNEATTALDEAIRELGVDTTDLEDAIALAESKTETDYSTESWNAMQEKLEIAKETLDSDNQAEIILAENALRDAIDALTIDYTELNDAITQAEAKVESDYILESWELLQEKLALAEDALSATKQSDIDTATEELLAAINGLEVDETELEAAIELALEKDFADYSHESWIVLEEKLSAAKEIQGSGATKAQIDKATEELLAAIEGLTVDKTELQAMIDVAESKNEKDYTEESWKAFKDVLGRAQEVLQGDSKQSEIYEITLELERAVKGLTVKIEDVIVPPPTGDYNTSAIIVTMWIAVSAAILVREQRKAYNK